MSWIGVGIYSETLIFSQFERHDDRRMRCTHTTLSSAMFRVFHFAWRKEERKEGVPHKAESV